MSDGPIKKDREAHRVKPATTAAKDRVCREGRGLNATLGKAYCGRSSTKKAGEWAAVTCSECHAARRADEAARS